MELDSDLDNIWEIVEELQKIPLNKDEHCSALIQIHTCAVTLWNLAVGMKTEGSGNLTLNAKCKSLFKRHHLHIRGFEGSPLHVISHLKSIS